MALTSPDFFPPSPLLQHISLRLRPKALRLVPAERVMELVEWRALRLQTASDGTAFLP